MDKNDATSAWPDLLTPAETISYLGLDREPGNAAERLRNLIRRQALPVLKRGRLQRFRRAAVDVWLEGSNGKQRIQSPARLVAG